MVYVPGSTRSFDAALTAGAAAEKDFHANAQRREEYAAAPGRKPCLVFAPLRDTSFLPIFQSAPAVQNHQISDMIKSVM
jgi:hypothetical protein